MSRRDKIARTNDIAIYVQARRQAYTRCNVCFVSNQRDCLLSLAIVKWSEYLRSLWSWWRVVRLCTLAWLQNGAAISTYVAQVNGGEEVLVIKKKKKKINRGGEGVGGLFYAWNVPKIWSATSTIRYCTTWVSIVFAVFSSGAEIGEATSDKCAFKQLSISAQAWT